MEPDPDLPSHRTLLVLRTKGQKSNPIAGWFLLPHRAKTANHHSAVLRSSADRLIHQGPAVVPADLQEEVHAVRIARNVQQDGEELNGAQRYPDEELQEMRAIVLVETSHSQMMYCLLEILKLL